eukprot:scaffold49602_cov63-Phaeocystis_antarctica.AAC.8
MTQQHQLHRACACCRREERVRLLTPWLGCVEHQARRRVFTRLSRLLQRARQRERRYATTRLSRRLQVGAVAQQGACARGADDREVVEWRGPL